MRNTSRPPLKSLQRTDLLVQFELDNLPEEYRGYYSAKRNNLFASIQDFPEVWRYYLDLDEIMTRELKELSTITDSSRMFPVLLYINAHAKIRVSFELAFTCCMSEARSIFRDAIEFVAHAHCMLSDPRLQEVWLNKNDDAKTLDAFKKAFEHQKKKGLFNGLEELHKAWSEMSEMGAHANINAMIDCVARRTSGTDIEMQVNYTGILDQKMWALSVFTMLLTYSTIERTLFNDYGSRLNLDTQLWRLRERADTFKEQLRENLKGRFKLEPSSQIVVPRPVIFRL